jgi:hypothetical protein
MKQFILELLSNEYFILGVMSIIICLITQILKMPIKIFTNKIKNVKVEKRVTTLLMLLPLALGILFNFVYNTYYLHVAFSAVQGLSWGTTSIMFYQGLKRFLTGQETPEQEKKELKSVKDLVEEIAKDGKVDNSDTSAVKDFLNKVK